MKYLRAQKKIIIIIIIIILVKLDLSNAFNSLHRDSMLMSVEETIPELAAYCHLAYAEATCLQFGSFTIKSQEGPQQGDPLGPLLFCLPLQSILTRLLSPLGFGRSEERRVGKECRSWWSRYH